MARSRCKHCGTPIARLAVHPDAPLSDPMHCIVSKGRDGYTYRDWYTHCEGTEMVAEPDDCEEEDCCWTGACETCTCCSRSYCTHEAELFASISKEEEENA